MEPPVPPEGERLPEPRPARARRRWPVRAARWIERRLEHLIRRAGPGVAVGTVLAFTLGQGYVGSLGRTGLGTWVDFLGLAGASLAIAALIGLGSLLALRLAGKLPPWLLFVLAGTFLGLSVLPFTVWPTIVGAGALVGGLCAVAISRGLRSRVSLALLATAAVALAVPAWWLTSEGDGSHLATAPFDTGGVAELDLTDPTAPGPWRVLSLTYGSGTDRRRFEYGDGVTIRTDPVDASDFMPGLGPEWREALREWFWGFDEKSLPLNARVWCPDGSGPFPLVLVVHGNHQMEDFSDGGYAWLGEHLASRGYVCASVDENFLNGNWVGDYGQRETVVRTWLLFQHLALWKRWNSESSSPFAGKVDLEKIALVGHSRGGQAVTTAAHFNRLPAHPEKATHAFDFGFGLRSIVSIAPNDPYKPSGAHVPVENINFLTLHGGHDADVVGFWGLQPYYRARFTDGAYYLKSAVYMYRGNHGQFNTAWGRYDVTSLNRWFLNTSPLMPGEDQRRAARAFITAFFEATLLGRTEYVAFLRDHRRGLHWLPEDIYVTQFEDSSFRPIADFSEDLDVYTTTVAGGRIRFERLTHVSENLLSARDGGSFAQKVIYLGWDRDGENEDEEHQEQEAEPPFYSIALPDGLSTEWELGPKSRLIFILGNSKREPLELDLTLVLKDAGGNEGALRLSHFAPLHPPLISRISKWPSRVSFGANRDFEQVPRTYEIPIAEYSAAAPEFDPAGLREIRFVFDETPSGEVLLGRVGLDPGKS